MNVKSNVKKRTSSLLPEPDPELLWKSGQGNWREPGHTEVGEGAVPGNHKSSSFWSMLFMRLVISTAIFIAIWGVNKFEPSWSTPVRAFIAQSLTQELDFGAMESWYEENFGGSPIFIPIFQQVEEKGMKVNSLKGFVTPLNGTVATPFALNLKGIEITPSELSSSGTGVQNIETGRVLEVSQDAFTGKTVSVQHASGMISMYGHLEQLFVEKGDWLETGELIGSLAASSGSSQPTLYFALKKDNRYIDPSDVIPFD
jgi:stage IV sporulation protein FA